MVLATYDPTDQKRRRQRARIRQQDIAAKLQISDTAISDYENKGKALPFALTSGDYEVALAQLITEQAKKGKGK